MSDFEKAAEGAKMDFSKDMSYGDYLGLDPILNAQHPLSDAHDEMLFIVQHQTSELWMRLAIHELEAARASLVNGELPAAFKMLSNCFLSPENDRATNDAPSSMASPQVSIGGRSFTTPFFALVPMSAVGENCPFVRP